jgi:Predicted nucleotide-binding protein containing TIR-like domain
LAKFLRALALVPKSLFDVGGESGPNPNILRIVRHGMRHAEGVIAFFTPDELPLLTATAGSAPGAVENTSKWHARVNAIFGAGLALGVAAKRTIVVGLGSDVGLLGDFRGIHAVNLDNGRESRNLLRQKLKAVGCVPDIKTEEHFDVARAGDFAPWLGRTPARSEAGLSK